MNNNDKKITNITKQLTKACKKNKYHVKYLLVQNKEDF